MHALHKCHTGELQVINKAGNLTLPELLGKISLFGVILRWATMDEQIHWAKEAVGKGTVETVSDGGKEHCKGSKVGKR